MTEREHLRHERTFYALVGCVAWSANRGGVRRRPKAAPDVRRREPRDDRVDVGQLAHRAATQPRSSRRRESETPSEWRRRACPAARTRRRTRGSPRRSSPKERNVDAERLCPRAVRPRRVARDRERRIACRGQVVAPVTQEQQLGRSARRPVVEVEAEERPARSEHVAKRARLLAGAPRPGRPEREPPASSTPRA